MAATEKKTVILHIRVEESVADALQALARADDRKLSPYVARLLRQHVQEHAPPPAPKSRKP